MKLLVVHLSDIHIATPRDHILGKGVKIVEAVRNLDYQLDLCAVVVSGDVAFAGTDEQYALARQFLEEITSELRSYFEKRVAVFTVVVPGNHDCLFGPGHGLRDMLLDQLAQDPAKARDDSVVEVCTAVQEDFFEFRDAVAGACLSSADRLYYEYRLPSERGFALIRCYNTAWLSRLNEEPAKLAFPVERIPTEDPGASVVISVFHHPYNWLTPGNLRAFRERVEAVSDIVLTGHEHEHARRVQQKAAGEVNQYIEGDILQESKDDSVGAFNVLLLDTAPKRQKFWHFTWGDGLYRPSDPSGGSWEEFQVNRLRATADFVPSTEMSEWLNELSVPLTHRDRGSLTLEEVFVYPDLRDVTQKTRDPSPPIRGETVFQRVTEVKNLLITGADQSGKTALAKRLFVEFRSQGLVPLFVDGAGLKPQLDDDRLYGSLYRIFAEQYDPRRLEQYKQMDRSRRILIVDDFHKIRINRKGANKLLDQLTRFAGRTMLLANDIAQQAQEIVASEATIDARVSFGHYKIQEFGYRLRNELVEKWFLLSPSAPETGEALVHGVTQVNRTLDAIIGRHFVPSYPIYILSVLQAYDLATPVELKASTHGYFYEMFIRAALQGGVNKTDIDIKTAYLGSLAYHLFTTGMKEISPEALEETYDEYRRRYAVPRISFRDLVDDLIARRILARAGERFRFKYRYVYFYFVASYLRDHIHEPAVRAQITDLSRRLYVDEASDILLFLVHLSKDPFIIEQMLESAARLFEGYSPATLADDVAFLTTEKAGATATVYVERDTSVARKEMLERLDELSNEEEEDDGEDRSLYDDMDPA